MTRILADVLDISPSGPDADFRPPGDPQTPDGAAEAMPATSPMSLATDQGPPELSTAVRQMLVRLARTDSGNVRRFGLTGLGDVLQGTPMNSNGHHASERDYDAEKRRQRAAARAAGFDIGPRGEDPP